MRPATSSGAQRGAALYHLGRVRSDSGTGTALRTIEMAIAEDGVDTKTRAAAIVLAVHLRLANGAGPAETRTIAREALELARAEQDVGL